MQSQPGVNLPTPLTPLIGRSGELRDLRRQIIRDGVRLITLSGPPGVGKTRLAIEVCVQVGDRFEAGAQLVDLAPVTTPAQMLTTIVRILGGDERLPAMECLKQLLKGGPRLLLLDNLEQLLPDAAPFLAELLQACPVLTVLVTSREAIRLRGEHVFVVTPLALPHGEDHQNVTRVKRSPAVALFASRAREVVPGFTLTSSNTPAIVGICRLLDGLPLAIELAAARTLIFPPEILLAHLEHPLELLSDGALDLPERHQTLHAAIRWSYDLLDPAEQSLLRRLSIFSGGCTLEAIMNVAPDEGHTINGLTSLVRKNLVRVDHNGDIPPGDEDSDQTRFTLLETIREFALEQLEARPDEHNDALRRHATFYLDLAEQTAAAIMDPQQKTSFDVLEQEHGNLLAAQRWTISDDSSAELAVRLSKALTWFWFSRGYLNEGWYWLELVQRREKEVTPAMRANIYFGLSAIALRRGDFPRALAEAYVAIDLLRPVGNQADLAHILGLAGQAALGLHDLDQAEELIAEALTIARDIENAWQTGGALWELSLVALRRGDYARSIELATEVLGTWTQMDDLQGTVLTMDVLSAAARGLGDLDRSRQIDEESLAMRRELGDRPGIGVSLRGLAEVAQLRHQDSRARSLYSESLGIAVDVGDLPGAVLCLEGLAANAVRHNHLERAATFLGAAEQIREQTGFSRAPASPMVDESISAVRAKLSDAEIARAWNAGHAQPLATTVTSIRTHLVNSVPASPRGERTVLRSATPLSPRERQVAAFIAQGHDNSQIATELFLSKRTVETHVSNILRKLDLDSRVQIVLWATHHGLTVKGSA